MPNKKKSIKKQPKKNQPPTPYGNYSKVRV